MRTVLFITLALALSVMAIHAEETPSIPMPPGTTLLTEINLSDSDILEAVKMMIPAFAQGIAGTEGEVGKALAQIDLTALSEAVRGVKQVRVIQMQLGAKPDTASIVSVFEKALPSEDGWLRSIYDTTIVKNGAVAVYTRSGQEFFLFAVAPDKQRAVAARIVGFIDIPKIAAWAGNIAKQFVEATAATPTKERQPEPIKAEPTKPAEKTPANRK